MLTLLLLVQTALVCGVRIRAIANFTVPNAAFVQVVNNDLYVTAFGIAIPGTIYRIADIGRKLTTGAPIVPSVAVTGLVWPNEITPFPNNASGFLFGDGFLPPGKSTGSLSSVVYSNGAFTVNKLTADKSGWWYHKGMWADVNCDGVLDIVTARGTAGWIGGSGELVWIDGNAPHATNHIVDGPDVNFDINYLNGSSAPFVVYAAEFFGARLGATQISCGGGVAAKTVLDNSIGEVFAVQLVDLDNSGRQDQLVVTNYKYSPPGSLFLYTLANPLKVAQRQTVSSSFRNVQWSPGSGGPGQVLAVPPNVPARAGDRAVLAVAGDGAETLTFFAPNATAASGYSVALEIAYGVTVGGICASDVDGDGHSEVFVALYETSTVVVFEVQP